MEVFLPFQKLLITVAIINQTTNKVCFFLTKSEKATQNFITQTFFLSFISFQFQIEVCLATYNKQNQKINCRQIENCQHWNDAYLLIFLIFIFCVVLFGWIKIKIKFRKCYSIREKSLHIKIPVNMVCEGKKVVLCCLIKN